MKFIVRLVQLGIIVTPVILFGYLATQWFVPSGVFYVSHTVGEGSPFIDEINPSQRVGEVRMNDDGLWVQPIVSDPTFFFVHPHRDFEQIDLEVWFQNEDVPIIEIGGLTSADPEIHILQPIHNKLIDDSVWDRFDENGLVLLQRDAKYTTIEEFFSDPPSRNSVATYRADFDVPYRMENYWPSSYVQTIDASLRGHHELKTYIKDETLSFEFEYMDMNRDEGEDLVSVLVFNEDGLPVAEARAEDDGNITDDAVATGLENLILTVPGLQEGVYKLVINTTRDIFFRKIHTPQQKMVFLNTVFIGDEVGYREIAAGTTFWAKAELMRAQTRHAEGVQTMSVEADPFDIVEPYQWYTYLLDPSSATKVTVPAGDVEIVLEGNIAFSQSQYFDPDPVSLTYLSDLDELGIDFVLASYTSPREEDGWLVATTSFSTKDLYTEEDGTWKFTISTPGIDDLGAEVMIHQINAWFYRDEINIE